MESAHRVAYEFHCGPIPDGMRVLHRCDNPPCINPDHLFLGTQAENVADMISKGRKVVLQGEGHGSAKLTKADVLAIRAARGSSSRQLAVQYGVHSSQICRVRAGKKWGSV